MRGAERDVVLEALGLAEAGERDEFPTESPIQGAALADGWYVVVLDQYGHALLNDETLSQVSEVGEVVAGMAEEHVMCSYSGAWQHGQRVWCAMHDAQEGIRLDVEGQMPRGFDQIRGHLLSQQAPKAEPKRMSTTCTTYLWTPQGSSAASHGAKRNRKVVSWSYAASIDSV